MLCKLFWLILKALSAHRFIVLTDAFRSQDLHITIPAKHPTQECRGRADQRIYLEMVFVDLLYRNSGSKLINDRVHDIVLAKELHMNRFVGAEHPEHFPGVFRQIETMRCRDARFIRQWFRQAEDPIQAEILHFSAHLAVTDHIVIVTIPDERIRTHHVVLAIMSDDFPLFCAVISILKLDLVSAVDSFIDRINDVIPALVLRFHPTLHMNMAA